MACSRRSHLSFAFSFSPSRVRGSPRGTGSVSSSVVVAAKICSIAASKIASPSFGAFAIPLTLLVKAVLIDTDPSAAWANALIGSTRAMRHESESELTEETEPVDAQTAEGGSAPVHAAAEDAN